MKLAAVQMVSSNDIDQNLARATYLIEEAAKRKADIVLLPENFLCYGNKPDIFLERQHEIKTVLSEIARNEKIWLVSGTMPWNEATDSGFKPWSSCFVFDDNGNEVCRYDKIHLFDADVNDATGAYRESDTYSHGNNPGVFDTPWGKCGIAICYDLRFPEYFRVLTELGAKIIFVPSAFTYVTGEAHWEVLLRARAIENQVFVAAADQGGEHSPTRKTWGESMIVSPWGKIFAKTKDGEGLVLAYIDLNEIDAIRKKMPVLHHQKFTINKK